MKLIKIVKAYSAARNIAPRKLEMRFNYAICKTLRQLQGDFEFYALREQELVKQFAKCDDKGEPIMDGNKFSFRDSESAAAYINAHRDLDEMEIEQDDYKRPRAPWPDDTEPEYVMALENFIDFAEPEDD